MEIRFKGTLHEFRALFNSQLVIDKSTVELPVEDENSEGEWASTEVSVPTGVQSPVNETDKISEKGQFSVEEGDYWKDQFPPMPEDDDPYMDRPPVLLPSVPDDLRKEAWDAFVDMVRRWTQNFGVYDAPQPDRLNMMQEMGHGRFTLPIVIMAYEAKSLQRLIEKALKDAGMEYDLDFVDQIACNMVQVSHMGFPDLAGTYDYSTKWKRFNPWA